MYGKMMMFGDSENLNLTKEYNFMKKMTAAVLCLILALSLFGCGKNDLPKSTLLTTI